MYTRKYLDQRHSVIVDRCNFDRDQRRTWIDLANHYKVPIDCIVLTANQEVNRVSLMYIVPVKLIIQQIRNALIVSKCAKITPQVLQEQMVFIS